MYHDSMLIVPLGPLGNMVGTPETVKDWELTAEALRMQSLSSPVSFAQRVCKNVDHALWRHCLKSAYTSTWAFSYHEEHEGHEDVIQWTIDSDEVSLSLR